jgi:hypothetical protein
MRTVARGPRHARGAGQCPDGGGLESGRNARARGYRAMSRIDARIQIVDTERGRTFTERFDATPIRIGRALGNDLFLLHPKIAARHGEIAIGPRAAYYRNHAWLRSSRIDGVRVKRGCAVKLTHESVISLGPFEVTVWFRVRDRGYERERTVTPLVVTPILLGPEARFGRAADLLTPNLHHERPRRRAAGGH